MPEEKVVMLFCSSKIRKEVLAEGFDLVAAFQIMCVLFRADKRPVCG